jgi:hypothetical protein
MDPAATVPGDRRYSESIADLIPWCGLVNLLSALKKPEFASAVSSSFAAGE